MSELVEQSRKRKNGQTFIERTQELVCKIKRSSFWTVQEKENLLVGLKKYGFSNLKGVAKVIRTKNAEEVRQFCLNRKLNLCKTQEKNTQSETKLEVWKEKIVASKDPRIHSPFPYNQSALKEAMVSAKIECKKNTVKPSLRIVKSENPDENEDSSMNLPDFPNLPSIYKYLTSLMANEVPVPLGSAESLLVLNLISDLLGVFKAIPLEKEKQFLKCLGERETIPFALNVKKEEITEDYSEANDEGSGSFNISKYPKLDILEHPNKFAISEMNQLQIPKEFLREEYELIDDLLKEREKLFK